MHLRSTCCCCLPAPLGASVLLGSRLLWVPPHPLCVSALLPWLIWGSFCFVRDPASLDLLPPPYCVLYCPGFSGTAFCSDRVPASLGTSPFIVCFNVLTSLGQHFILLGSGFSESLPIPCFLLLFWLLWDSFCFVRDPATLGPSP